MNAQKDTTNVNTPRAVIRGVNSHKSNNETGLHWLRISIPYKHLKILRAYCDSYFGESFQDFHGLWGYDTRYSWTNKASLFFDSDLDRAALVHGSRATLEIPGGALDGIAHDRLYSFVVGLQSFDPNCTRCDIFFDDYKRLITPKALHRIVKKEDYSGFRKFQIKRSYKTVFGKKRNILLHDEIDFGRRGESGCGKYLRVYDKTLESKGEKNCIRWEIEFCNECSHKVFDKLCQVKSVKAFATLCGSLIGGAIVFVHRSSEKNIGRLVIYDFWQQIKNLLGCLVVRMEVKPTDIDGMYRFIFKQVSPTMATLRKTFVDDSDFFVWLFDVLDGGELRMSQRQVNLAKANKKRIRYRDGKVFDEDGVLVA